MKRALPFLLLAGCSMPGGAYRLAEESPAPGRLRAGEVDDNRSFDDYLRYFKAYPDRNVRKIDVTDRQVLTFTDGRGRPVALEGVRILAEGEEIYRGVTTAAGRLMFPPRAVGVDEGVRRLEARIAGRRVSFRRGEDVEIEVDVETPDRDRVDLDVAFCLDTTGSMADEIDRLKRTLRDVADRIDGLQPRPRLRLGMVLYRDRGDEYVTRCVDFTADLDRFQSALSRVKAAAGGDYEESVSEALEASTGELSWSAGEAIRILFLVGDAPPHTDRPGGADYSRAMRRALEGGIKIHALAASGLDDKGEFIWRQLAQFTLGKFMFISYGGTTRHHVGGYRENNLDDLMVRAVAEEVEALRPRPSRPRPPSEGRGREPDDFRLYRGR